MSNCTGSRLATIKVSTKAWLIIAEQQDGHEDNVNYDQTDETTHIVKQETQETGNHDVSTTAPLRPFDVNSLIKKETTEDKEAVGVNNNHDDKTPVAVASSPDHVAPSPPSLYPYLGLYSHLMSHSLPPNFPAPPAASNHGPPLLPPGLNPLMMQAHLALAAHHNSVLASAYANLAPSSMMERIKSQRFSPYPPPAHLFSPPSSTSHPSHLSSDSKSAFHSIVPGRQSQASLPPPTPSSPANSLPPTPSSPPPSPSSNTATTSLRVKTITPPSLSPANSHSSTSSPGDLQSSKDPRTTCPKNQEPTVQGLTTDIKSIEKMVNGLNGGHDTTFGISHGHDQRRSLAKSQ